MISRMAKPEEVLVVENEQGEVVREFLKDTDSINMYKNMKETLGGDGTFVIIYYIYIICVQSKKSMDVKNSASENSSFFVLFHYRKNINLI